MKNFDRSIKGALTLAAVVCSAAAMAQLNVAAVNTAYTINFDGTVAGVGNGIWAGTGFQPTPTSGRLDSDAWQVTGWSNGNLAFGGTRTTASTDYTRGAFPGGVATGGMYSFNGGAITGKALGFQMGASDWEPGTIVLRVQNTTGSILTEFDIAYNVFWNNDQAFSSSFNFSYSSDNVTYTSVGALDVVSPTTADGLGFTLNARSTTISGLNIANNGYFYLRWRGAAVSGAGARDEFALDDISVTGRAYTVVRFTGATSAVNEDGASTTLTVAIVNPDNINATSVDVALTSGSAARINGYTTQTVTFPAASSANQTVTVTITDNGTCDGNETLVFTLQNQTGGNNPSVGSPGVHTMTLDDNETAPRSWQQYFDSGVNDLWPIVIGGSGVSTNTGAADVPVGQRILTATSSWQVINLKDTLLLGAVDVQDWSSITLTMRVTSTENDVDAITNQGADGADSVAIYVSLDGGAYPADPDIRIAGNSNARWGYTTGTGVASTTAGVPLNFQPAGGGNRTTDGYSHVSITVPNGTQTVAVRVIAVNNNNQEVWNIDNVAVSGIRCNPIYYSRGSGSETAVNWSTTRTGTATAVTFNKNASMVVQLGHTITTTNNPTFDLYSLTVESGGSMTVQGNGDMDIHGPIFDIDGTFSSIDDDFTFKGEMLQDISGSGGVISVDDLTLDSTGGIILSLIGIRIYGTLQLDQGNFNDNGKVVRLMSTISGTARLGPVASGATYTGDVQIDRYIPAGVTDWRLLCSPVQGRTIYNWTDDFTTSGFPGSTWPGFSFNSIRTYDETNPGASSSDGLTGATGSTDPLTPGVGFAVWSGATLGGTPAFTIDLKGAPTIAQSPFTIPMSYTNTSNPPVDGLNLVANPLPSPIDFGLVSLDTDVDNFYYIYDPGSGTNAAWDEGLQVGTGGTNGNIQSSQGFWLHCTGSNNTVTVDEGAKVLEPIAGGVFSLSQETRAMLRMNLSTALNDYTNEALVHFIGGDPLLDTHDVPKFDFDDPNAPSIAAMVSGQPMTIDAMGELEEATSVDVQVDVAVTGDHTITFSDLTPLLSRTCVTLEDIATGSFVPVLEGAQYTFFIDANDPPSPARFVLHFAEPIAVSHQPVSCPGGSDGSVSALGGGTGPWDYTWTNDMGTIIGQEVGATTASTLTGLGVGTYVVSIAGSDGCGAITRPIEVTQPLALDAAATAQATGCPVAADGGVDLTIAGGTAPYTFIWSTGAITEDLASVATGSYDVTITDANGCQQQVIDQVVAAGSGPEAAFMVSNATPNVGEDVDFFNFSTYGAVYAWDLGDGTTSTDADVIHVYALPGTYTVTLQVIVGDCISEYSMDITALGSTGIGDRPTAESVSAWSDELGITVEWLDLGGNAVVVEVIDMEGRLVGRRNAESGVGRLHIPTMGLEAGTYVIRVRKGTIDRAFKLPLVR